MKKIIARFFKLFISLSLFNIFILTKASNAFIPTINEPNIKELKSTSIKIGKTAIQLLQYGQHNEAIKLLKLAIKLNPQEIALWISLAEAQIRSDKKKNAIISLNKAIKLDPKKESLYFSLASIYIDLNNPKKAKIIIKKGLSINNKNERGHFQLGNVEIMLKNYKLALISFKKSSKINEKFWQSINNEGLILYELNNLKEAISKFTLALQISNDAEPMLALAIAKFSSKKNNIESIGLAKNALDSNPKYISKDYQAKQLWGEKLQKSAKILFKTKEMKKVVKAAKEKSQ